MQCTLCIVLHCQNIEKYRGKCLGKKKEFLRLNMHAEYNEKTYEKNIR